MGLLLAVLVTAADVDDAKAAEELFAQLQGQPMGRVQRMYADNKYHNFTLYEWVEKQERWHLTIVRRPKGTQGWRASTDPVDRGANVRLAGQVPPAE
jgi:putative transposase